MTDLILNNIDFAYGHKSVVQNLSVRFKAGAMTALVGLNGAGKSTCLKLAAGLLPPDKGAIAFSDDACFENDRQRINRIAYLPQFQPVAWALLCREIVRLGRLPYPPDDEAIETAMQLCGVADFADTAIDNISGGEQACVLLARIIASDAKIYLLDEPVRSLDLRRQVQVMSLLSAQARAGKAVIVVLHDLSLAARFCDEVVLLHQKEVIAHDTPEAVFTQTQLSSIFGVEMDMIWNKTA